MVLMSGDNKEKRENLQGESNTDSVSSDSGISNCSKEDSSKSQRDNKSASPSQKQEENESRKSKFFQSFPRRGSDRDYSEFFDDPFFSERTSSKLFGNKSRLGNRPRLSERIFGNRKPGSVFDNDHFVDDLRKKIEEEKKMFFDGGSDPFTGAFGGGRPASPVGGAGRANFPFDDLRSGARARFDEFANRHPMFSTMRNQPAWNLDDPFGHHGFPRERHHSGSSGAGSGASTASTGEERVIPIQIIRDDPPKTQQQQQQQAPQQRGKSPSPPSNIPNRLVRESSPQPQASNGPQRCNTEPNHSILIEDNRSSRAQSAPPVSQLVNENPTSKMTINPNESKPQGTQVGGHCSKNSKSEPATGSNTGGGVRSIPIIIEGRKVPDVNSSSNGNCSTGQSPPQAKVSRPAERSPTPPPKKPAPPKNPLDQVDAVLNEAKELEKQVDDFKGNSRDDREYLVLDEMLTRCLIKLDVVETEGKENIRLARKECIKFIQSCIAKLEKKADSGAQSGGTGDGDQTMDMGSQGSKSSETEKMEVGSQSLSDDSKRKDSESGNQNMDVDPSSTAANAGKQAESNDQQKS